MATDRSTFQGSFFSFEADGLTIGYFTGCSGLSIEHEVIEHKSTSVTGRHENAKVPGRRTYGEVVLKRGFTPDTALADWIRDVMDGKVERKTGSIIIFDYTGTEVGRFNFLEMWPSKISSSDPDTGSADILVEEVTLVHEHMDWVS